MPINRLLKDKRTPEEIELLNKAFNHAYDGAVNTLLVARSAASDHDRLRLAA